MAELSLYDKQMEVYRSPHRFKVVVAGRRSGKSYLARAVILKYARKSKQRVWYVAPTYRMAKQIMWDDMLEGIPPKWIKKINHSILTVRLVNNTLIELKGADHPDHLRGVGLNFVVLDEAQDMKADVWVKAIRPTLSSTGGGALICGTPKGYGNVLYELYRLGQREDYQTARVWNSWHFMTQDSPFVPYEEIEQARRDMDPKSFEQEYLAHWISSAGRVYYPFDRNLHVGHYPFDPALPIWVGQDFNIDPMSSAIMQPQLNGEVWVVDEMVLPSSNTEEVCQNLERKFWRWQDNITIYPDPAGGSRQHARGETDLDIFREHGFRKIKYRKKHPAVADRINSVNRLLLSADGTTRFRVDASCHHTIKALEQTLYKPESRDVDKSAGVEHIMDGAGYACELEFPMRKARVGGLSI